MPGASRVFPGPLRLSFIDEAGAGFRIPVRMPPNFARNSRVNLLCFLVSTLEIATKQDNSRNGSEGNYVRHWGMARNEAGAGFRLEELECAHPVDDELDANDEDQEAHDAYDRADAGGAQLVDPGSAVA